MGKHKWSDSKRGARRMKRKLRKGQTMPFKDACDLVPDNLPDGAYWLMAHEIAGLDYPDGFEELLEEKA